LVTIILTGTMSRHDAENMIFDGKWTACQSFRSAPSDKMLWIGFDEGESYPTRLSPIRTKSFSRMIDSGRHSGIYVIMADYDPEGRDRGLAPDIFPPTQEVAEGVVRFLIDADVSGENIAVAVHCFAGVYRSGAVVQLLRDDFGVAEDPSSRRLIENRKELTYNRYFYRLMSEAMSKLAFGKTRDRMVFLRRKRGVSA